MAGSQDGGDNPVAVNVVPLVDVIFCLCVFFMCSFKFRQLEGKFDTWLPRDAGVPKGEVIPVPDPSEMRIALEWDERTGQVERRFGIRVVADDDDLERTIAGARDAWMERGRPDAPLTIDADVRVPWREVTTVVNLAKRLDVADVRFALGAPLPPKRGGR
jgi:biopolymer transport protein ExbD